jgi:hypothetical protein
LRVAAARSLQRATPRTLGGMATGRVDMKQYIAPALAGTIAGIVVLKWQWVLNGVGLVIEVQRGTGLVTFEYWIGFLAAAILGFSFPKHPIVASAFLMAGPTILTHTIHIVQYGFPRLWPVELTLLAALTVPYIGLALIVAHLRERANKAQNAT